MEKEVLGFYLSSHPLEEFRGQFETFCSHNSAELTELPDRTEITIGGMLSSIKFAHVRKVRPGSTATKYANFDLEDIQGMIRCILWPNDFEKFGEMIQPDAVVVIRGVIDRRGGGDDANLICNELIPIEQIDAKYTHGVQIRVNEGIHGEKGLTQLREIMRGYPGQCEVQLMLCLEDGSRVLLRSGNLQVDLSSEMRTRIEDLLGPGHFRLLSRKPRPTSSG